MRKLGFTVVTLALAGVIVLFFLLLPASTAWAMTIIELLIILCVLGASYPIWLFGFLRKKAQMNEVVTNVKEGTGKMVMQNGGAVRFLTSNAGTDPGSNWELTEGDEEDDDKGNEETPERSGALLKRQREFTWPIKQIDRDILPGAMRWIGFDFMGYELHRYHFRWEVLRSSEPIEEMGLVGKRQNRNGKWVASFAQILDYINTKDSVYYLEVIGAETKGKLPKGDDGKVDEYSAGMPVDALCVVTVRIVNAYLALIHIHDWLESVFDLLRPSIRSWMANSYYEDVLRKPEVAERKFDKFLQQTGVNKDDLPEAAREAFEKMQVKPKTIQEYIECAYGVRIKRIGFDDVVPPDAYVEASEKRIAAEQDKVRIETEANAESNRRQIVAKGEAAALKEVAAVMADPVAMELRRLEAFETVGQEGNMVVVSGEQNILLSPPQKSRTVKPA